MRATQREELLQAPHHRADGTLVWNGVAAAMTRLLHPATDIPDTDRRGVYNHLAAHYRQFDKEPPEFRSIAPPTLRSSGPVPRYRWRASTWT
jgi:hypothetical protein